MSVRTISVLLVEDDDDDRFLTCEALREVAGTEYDIHWVSDADSAIRELHSREFQVALLDFHLGAQTGLDVLSAVRHLQTPCILLTGQRDHETDVAAMEAGAADYLVKGDLCADDLERAIRYAIDRAHDLRSLRESELRFRAVVEAATDAILLTDQDGRLLTWNAAALRLFGLDAESAAGRSLTELLVGSEATDNVAALAALEDLRGRRIDGTEFPAALSLASWDSEGTTVWSAIVRNVTEQKDMEERLLHQAFHDPLTGLANRALFANRVEHGLVRLQRRQGSMGVLFLDLDDFKRINDSLGHAAGDELLTAVAWRLLGCVRQNDTVARFGGDEFAVLVEDSNDPHIPYVVAERIMKAMSVPFELAEREHMITCSIGVAAAVSADMTATELLRDADLAMYAAKSRGKSCVQLFENRMHTAIIDRMNTERDLRAAVTNHEIVPYFQPILDMQTGRLRGFEALARWRHPSNGVLSPATFIDIAESNGLIVAIGDQILSETCRQIAAWERDYDLDLSVSVNISCRQIEEADVVAMIAHALEVSGLHSSHLTLEITESMVVERAGAVADRIQKIAELGVGIAVDDFGTGYSSLAYLQDLPITTLKIDRSFVSRLETPRGGALVQAIIAMSSNLGLTTIAEGIETTDQQRSLQQFGCQYGQGYLFARPLNAEEAAARFLRTRNRLPQTA